MGNASSSHKISAQDKAILDMKNQRDKLHQYQKKITLLTDRETEAAREMIRKGDKPRALLALRRKKYQENLLSKTDAQLEQLEKLTSNVEFALVQKDVLYGLQQGTNVLNEINREMGGIENVQKLMGENEDAVAYQKEITEMLGGQMSNQEEDEVEDELEALADQVAGPRIPETPQEELPDVPTSDPKERAKARAKARAEEREQPQPLAA